ncbi:hypothetical protein C6P40_000865 [Pichia californica]|uniref:NET1-associated nuclear protein 1 n=1 Tax=Pichia californica TaxID=460514 RepID=A0A9P7BDT7_9ASCO|nr:hypothetical protein C6P40_000865 [[Candida] californica]
MTSDNDAYSLSFSSGGQVIPRLNKISNDGHYSVSFFNNHITVYSITSRLAIRSFYNLGDVQFEGIIDTFISSINNNLIYILSKNKEKKSQYFITILNWYDNVKEPIISSIPISLSEGKFPVQMINFQNETTVNLLTKTETKTFDIIPYDLNLNKSLKSLKSFENILYYSISTNFKNIVLTSKKRPFFTIFTFDDTNSCELACYTVNYSILKFNPVNITISNDQTNPLIAFGTNSGTIILLFDLTSENPPQRILKWHMSQPKSLIFNSDSTYLLSGGSEKVLVFWNILNEKQQFLPRLNGKIENISLNSNVPSLINLSLNVIDDDYEYLILGTTDLLSKLNISTPHLFSGLNKDNLIKKNIIKDLKSFEKSSNNQFTKFKHPYKLKFNINPKNNHLYLQAGRHLQIYDSLHNLQIDNIAVAPAIQQYGKIGSEVKIQDPMVIGSEFIYCSKTNEKDWLITCDAEVRGEAEKLTLESIEHWETLRFWKNSNSISNSNLNSKDKDNNGNSWILQTKMLRPHGDYPITSIVPAPKSYFGGEAVLTADSRGNVRLWRPNSQGIWSLRKFFSSGSDNSVTRKESQIKKNKDLNNLANNEGTVCCWCPDSSMIAIGRDGKVILLDVNTFEPIHIIKPAISESKFHTHATIDNSKIDDINENKILNPNNKTRYIDINLQDKHIISINFTSNGKLLVIETRSHLTVVDILKNRTIFGLILSGEKSSGFGGSIVRLTSRNKSNINIGDQTDLNDDTTDELLIIGKFFQKGKPISSKITLWNISDKKSTIECKWCKIYENSIIGAEWSDSWQQWILADTNSNFGELGYGKSYSRKVLLKENETKETNNWIVSSLLDNARIVNRASTTNTNNSSNNNLDNDTEEFNDRQGLKGGAFDIILDHLEGVSVSALFERVLKVV